MLRTFSQCIIVVCIGLWTSSVFAQSKTEIYRQNVVSCLQGGGGSASVARYWIQIGADVKAGRALKELPPEIKESVGKILDRYYESHNRRFGLPEDSAEVRAIDVESLQIANEVGDQLFEAIGPELLQRASQQYAKEQLASLMKDRGLDGLLKLFDRATNANNPLGLESKKIEQLGLMKRQFVSKQNEVNQDFLARLGGSTKKLWCRLLVELNDSQKSEAEKLMGRQAEWFRFVEQPNFRLPDHNSFGIRFCGETGAALFKQNMLEALEWSDQNLEAKGLEIIDPVVLELVSLSFIADELDLSNDQRERLKELQKSTWSKTGISLQRKSDNRFDLLLKHNAPLPTSLADILLPAQETWLLQIEMQVRASLNYRQTAGLTHPKLIEHLELSPGQIARLKEIGEDHSKEWEPIFLSYRKALEKLQVELVEEITLILVESGEKDQPGEG